MAFDDDDPVYVRWADEDSIARPGGPYEWLAALVFIVSLSVLARFIR